MEHFGVEPDLVIVAKSIAGGLPLSGVVGRATIMDAPHSGAIGGTFIGNPVALAAALAVLDDLRGRAARRPRAAPRRGRAGADARLAGALAADRRRPRHGRDAGDRARARSRDEGACARARRGRGRRGAAARPPAAQGRRRRQLHPRPLPAHDLGRRARRRSRAPGKTRSQPSCAKTPPVHTGEERKLVTVLFADLVGSTAYAGDRDPERVRAQLERFYDAMREEIELTGGTVEKFAGDAVMAVFGAPAALEDHAERALHAALAMQRRLHDLFGGDFEMRVGVNTGDVVVGSPREGSSFVTGDAVNVADRLQKAAEPGEVLAGERTVAAAGGAFEFSAPRTVEAKGKSDGVVASGVAARAADDEAEGRWRASTSVRRSRQRARAPPGDVPARRRSPIRTSSRSSASPVSGSHVSCASCARRSRPRTLPRSTAPDAVSRTARESRTARSATSCASTSSCVRALRRRGRRAARGPRDPGARARARRRARPPSARRPGAPACGGGVVRRRPRGEPPDRSRRRGHPLGRARPPRPARADRRRRSRPGDARRDRAAGDLRPAPDLGLGEAQRDRALARSAVRSTPCPQLLEERLPDAAGRAPRPDRPARRRQPVLPRGAASKSCSERGDGGSRDAGHGARRAGGEDRPAPGDREGRAAGGRGHGADVLEGRCRAPAGRARARLRPARGARPRRRSSLRRLRRSASSRSSTRSRARSRTARFRRRVAAGCTLRSPTGSRRAARTSALRCSRTTTPRRRRTRTRTSSGRASPTSSTAFGPERCTG